MEFADNYLLIGLIAAIVVVLLFIIWDHTRKDVECNRSYPFMKNLLPAPKKSNYQTYTSRLKVIDESSGGKLRCDFAFGKFIHDKCFDPNQIDDSAFDIWLLESFLNPRSVHKSTSKIPGFDHHIPLPEKPRKPVTIAPEQFLFHCSLPKNWNEKQVKRYRQIKRKYDIVKPSVGFGGLLDFFCMDCGHNDKLQNFRFSSSCPHCHSFRIKPVPYLPQAE